MKSNDILWLGVWFCSSSMIPGPCCISPGGRCILELRKFSAEVNCISLKEPRMPFDIGFPLSSMKLPLPAERKGREPMFNWEAARFNIFLGREGCIMGLCESWLMREGP